MKYKSQNLVKFIDGLHNHILSHPHFRSNLNGKTESQIQTEIRPMIVEYLTYQYKDRGRKNFINEANESFYWEGQEGYYRETKSSLFGSKNYPDFVITKPYNIAVEYKKNDYGSLVKQGIGQSIIHTLSQEFDYVYFLFHDTSKEENIRNSFISGIREKYIIKVLQEQFNVFLKIISKSDIKGNKK